ncbi:MAG TPA: glycosyltransferase family 2 protein [Burkholderiales bacterium]|nr:glycosyltransferase family 2 protein [Burkholderiales bacterium]
MLRTGAGDSDQEVFQNRNISLQRRLVSTLSPQQSHPVYAFTVFTAAYNSLGKIDRVYRSLCAQTFRDFEWLIVDDGSTDGTGELIESWKRECPFPLHYFLQKNQGKHAAFNRGVSLARGGLFLNLDHDDACVPQALERLKHHWDAIPAGQRGKFSAVTALCTDEYGKLLGTRFPNDITDSDSLEIRHRFHVKGEKWGFHRTEVLREFPFPKLKGEDFIAGPTWIPESVVWNAIARRFKTRYVNEPLRIFYNYDPDQSARLSQGSHTKHVLGGRLLCADELNHDLDWFRYAPTTFFKSAGNYVRWSLHSGIGIVGQWRGLSSIGARILWLVMLPVGYALYQRDRLKDERLRNISAPAR